MRVEYVQHEFECAFMVVPVQGTAAATIIGALAAVLQKTSMILYGTCLKLLLPAERSVGSLQVMRAAEAFCLGEVGLQQ